jgi:hypothetical protein
MFLSPLVDHGILLGAMVIHRATTMTGDVLAYGFSLIIRRIAKEDSQNLPV